MIFILDLSFGQRGRIVNAPINGFSPAIRVTFLHEIEQRAGDDGLVVMIHREIGIVPSPENSQTLKVPLMLLHVTRRKLAAKLSKFRRRNFIFSSKLLFHLRLNRQSMAVPAGDVWRVVSCHAFGFNDHIFQNLVESCAQMNRARGIRRTIVQNKQRLAFMRF